MSSQDEVTSHLDAEIATVKSDRDILGKRQHYLETTLKNTQSSLEQFLGRVSPK